VTTVADLNIKIFADGADISGMLELARNPIIKGFTTNPTLMRKSGISDYEAFAREVLAAIHDRPVSFEVFADDHDGMLAQGRMIGGWAPNVNVKIPVTNTRGEFCGPVIDALSGEGIAVNVTAIMTPDQVRAVSRCLAPAASAIISVFAGRVADTGRDPIPLMSECLEVLSERPRAELLWASPREFLNIFHAEQVGCHIITVTSDLLAKLGGVGKDLDQFSLETVQMFFRDAIGAGYSIRTPAVPKHVAV